MGDIPILTLYQIFHDEYGYNRLRIMTNQVNCNNYKNNRLIKLI